VNRIANWSPSVSIRITTEGLPVTSIGTVGHPNFRGDQPCRFDAPLAADIGGNRGCGGRTAQLAGLVGVATRRALAAGRSSPVSR